MRYIKRIIALTLALLMMSCGAYADGGEVSGLSHEYADKMALVSYLEISDAMSEDDAKATQILRGDFAVSVAKMLDLSVTENPAERYFIDVPNDHWAAGEIYALVNVGIISVSDDRYFRPDDAITDTEALKMIMTAAGYGDWAIANGGFPYGYIKAAKGVGMSDFSTGNAITYDKAVELLYEGLTIPIYDKVVFGDMIRYGQTFNNILSEYFYMHTDEGVVTYADGISVDGLEAEDEGYVRIDGETYKTELVFLPYVGQCKSFVYKQKDDGKQKEIVLLNNENINEKTLVIDRDDFIKYSQTENKALYYDNNKERSVKISASAIGVKNGKMLENKTSDAFDFSKGRISLIDSDENGEYDYILTFEYKNYVADRIDSLKKIVYDKASYANSINLDDNGSRKKVIIEKNGTRVGFDAIQEDDVLTVYESDVFVRAVITSGQITGNLYKISTDKATGTKKLSIGKNEKNIVDYILDEDCDSATIPSIGSSAAYYTDEFGKIVYIQYESGLPWQYAFLMNYAKESRFDTVVTLKLLMQSGKVETYEISDKVKIDGKREKDADKVLTYLNKSRYPSKGILAEGEDSVKGQLIRVKVNEDGEIVAIDTEYINTSLEETQSLKRTIQAQTLYYRYHPQSFDGKIIKNSNTLCFLVPKQNNIPTGEDKDFRIIPASSSYFWSKNHLIEGFKLDQTGGAEDVIVIYADAVTDSYDNRFFIVDSIYEGLNDEGNKTKELHLWADGVEYDFICDEDCDLSVETESDGVTNKYYAEEGDIVKLALDFNNNVTGVKILYDYSRRNDENYTVALGAMEQDYYTDQGNLFYAYVKKISNGIIGMRFSKPDMNEYINEPQKVDYITSMSGNAVMVYDSNARNNKISRGTLSDIIPGNNAGDDAVPYFLMVNKGIVIGAILYK